MEPLVALGIVLLIAGFILVGIEMVVPGFGAPGISGGICLVLGIVLPLQQMVTLVGLEPNISGLKAPCPDL